ncbi:MAG: glucuronate isomerase [Candidatus Binataceae bacterium]
MRAFLDDDFLLDTTVARHLYTEYAAPLPIIDYHSHLPAHDIATRKRIRNIGSLWLGADHYKWRLMRMAGIPERYITGDADDRDKFLAFCRILPQAIGNPVYHWCHLELRRLFQIDCIINEANAALVWDAANARLASMDAWSFLEQSNVEIVCTTDDPADPLDEHAALARSALKTRIVPTFRPDLAMRINAPDFPEYLEHLGAAASLKINSFAKLIEALDNRVAFFHSRGARVSDHSLETPLAARPASHTDIDSLFSRRLNNQMLDEHAIRDYHLAILAEMGRSYSRRGWAMCLHIGARRNTNSRAYADLGPDSGFDSISDLPSTDGLFLLLDTLDRERRLPKVVLFCMHPAMNELLASMIGNYSRDSAPGKLQFGPPWWFNDHKTGILTHLHTLASHALLGSFIGMTTDSRSFASYRRHEYFRRLLCSTLGRWVEDGEYPCDDDALRNLVQGICYHNAKRYFGLSPEQE